MAGQRPTFYHCATQPMYLPAGCNQGEVTEQTVASKYECLWGFTDISVGRHVAGVSQAHRKPAADKSVCLNKALGRDISALHVYTLVSVECLNYLYCVGLIPSTNKPAVTASTDNSRRLSVSCSLRLLKRILVSTGARRNSCKRGQSLRLAFPCFSILLLPYTPLPSRPVYSAISSAL